MYGSLDIRCNGQFFVDYFLPYFLPILNKSTKNYDILYRSWDMAHGGCDFHFFFLATFCPFKAPEHITILPMCTNNYDHILYCSWDIVHDGCNFHFFILSLLFALLKHLEVSPLYPCVPKIRMRWCMVSEIFAWRTDWSMNGEVTYRSCTAFH